MINKQLQDQLSLLMIRSGMKGKYAIMQIAEDHHITLMPAMTLCLLEPGHALPMKSIAQFMSCDPSNITGIIEQLVSEGLVERRESPLDRRVKTISITKKGLKLRDKFLEITSSSRLPNLAALNDQETSQLIAILEKATGTSTKLNEISEASV